MGEIWCRGKVRKKYVAKLRAGAEYRAMAMATCELIWIKQLLKELKFGEIKKMELVRDNEAAVHSTSIPVFHERTKHIRVIAILSERWYYPETSSQSLCGQMISLMTYSPKSLAGPGTR